MLIDETSGRTLVIGTLEITSIPKGKDVEQENSTSEDGCGILLGQDIALFLNEQRKFGIDAMAEIVLYAEPSHGQIHPSTPRILLNLYSSHPDVSQGKRIVRPLLDTLRATLTKTGYDCKESKDSQFYDNVLCPIVQSRSLISLKPREDMQPASPQPSALSCAASAMRDLPETAISILFASLGKISADVLISAPSRSDCGKLAWKFTRHFKTFNHPSYPPVGAYIDYLDTRSRLFNHYGARISESLFHELLRLPVGEACGIPVSKTHEELPPFPKGYINGEGMPMGRVQPTGSNILTLPFHKKTWHMSVLGSSGSGKSTFLLNFLKYMWNEFGKPFLIVDPVTKEYRCLRRGLKGQRLNVFTPGSGISPFTFNPFALPMDDLAISEYKNLLLDFILNSFDWYSPLDKLLPDALDDLYVSNGWFSDSTTTSHPGKPVNIDDFKESLIRIINEIPSYEARQNCIGIAEARLRVMKSRFNTYAPLPINEICQTPTVIELGYLHDSESKSMMLLYILSMVKPFVIRLSDRQQVKSTAPNLLFVIDEAHTIMEKTNHTDSTNKAQTTVVGMVNSLLFEFRKYGLSVILADQRTSVLQQVMENTQVQIVFKLLGDTETTSRIIRLSRAESLQALGVGEAYVQSEGLEKPVAIKTQDFESEAVSDEEVRELMSSLEDSFWARHAALSKPYPQCAGCSLAQCNTTVRSRSRDIIHRSGAHKNACRTIAVLDQLTPDFQALKPYLPVELQGDAEKYYACVHAQLLHLLRPAPDCIQAGCTHCNESVSRMGARYALMIFNAKKDKPQNEDYSLGNLLKAVNGGSPKETEQLRRCIKVKLSQLVEGHQELEYLIT